MKCHKPWKNNTGWIIIQIELVPPGTHRRNASEATIRNFKAHFLSVLAGTSQDFRHHCGIYLLPQAEITINLLRQSNATPNVSACAHLSGPFGYNKMPLAPMGMSVQVHKKTDKRGTRGYHTVDGWYLATSPEHYRTHRRHIKSINNKLFTDTIHFSHINLTQPTITHDKNNLAAIADCAKAIKNLGNGNRSKEMNQLIQIIERAIQQKNLLQRHLEQQHWASKIEGATEQQQQQHTPDKINDTTHSTITKNSHASSS